ncbi:MAG: hypothetical protein FWF28_10530, partial [Micrococcales bacterium]|nr:hypothetical protein [Micrococcales bacterium]
QSQLTDLLDGLGLTGLDPSQLLSVLHVNGASLSSGQLNTLTSTITGLLSGVGNGTTFTDPSNPLGSVGSLLNNVLCLLLC